VPSDRKIDWDKITKRVSVLAILGSAVWTLIIYLGDRHKEVNAFVFQQQTTLYLDAARSAATLATSKNDTKLKDARERFDQLFYGELVVVEDRRVELAMISFRRCLVMNNKECDRVETNQYQQPIAPVKLAIPAQLDNLSLELAACIRSALQQDRKIQFGNVKNAETSCPYD